MIADYQDLKYKKVMRERVNHLCVDDAKKIIAARDGMKFTFAF